MTTTFAVIKTGGKQYKVSEGQTLKIEKIIGDYKEGDKIIFDEVVLLDDGKKTTVGTPTIKGQKVTAELIESAKGKKLRIQHFKSKSNYSKVNGHRQPFFEVKITKI
jgi:large subunit ribosomal protein L21